MRRNWRKKSKKKKKMDACLPEDTLQDTVESRVQHLISGWKDVAKIKSVQGVRFATLNMIRSIIPEEEVPLVRLIEVFDALHQESGDNLLIYRDPSGLRLASDAGFLLLLIYLGKTRNSVLYQRLFQRIAQSAAANGLRKKVSTSGHRGSGAGRAEIRDSYVEGIRKGLDIATTYPF